MHGPAANLPHFIMNNKRKQAGQVDRKEFYAEVVKKAKDANPECNANVSSWEATRGALLETNDALRKQIESYRHNSIKLTGDNQQIQDFVLKTKQCNSKLVELNNKLKANRDIQKKSDNALRAELTERLTQEKDSLEKQLALYQGIQKDGYTKILKTIFSDAQIRCVQGVKDFKWSKLDRLRTSSLRIVSPEACEYMKQVYKYPMPSEKT